ncbi:L-carnitine dehydrogenase [Nocardioides aquaticus]|uniref:L-carnitine dehydrogenase n=1 Tax=Nocardioides aquaticus TaxID=160826 RepID=A0ABX8EDY5_9ACTN|nr:thioesterase family protein [Nocardioides aquaticus]QVT78125.1 L-carnitine dehydrogenase [Nocardioides aquaticus]
MTDSPAARPTAQPTTAQVLALHTATDTTVPEDHIDENGHMNIGHYFSAASWAVWDLTTERVTGADYIARRGSSFFTVEHRIAYLGELRLGERYSVHAALAGRTDKALHGLALVLDRERDRVACRMEVVYLHVDMDARRSSTMPDDVAARAGAEVAAHPWVADVATGLSLRRPS